MIEFAVRERLVDGLAKGVFKPDANLTRGQMADYLTAGAALKDRAHRNDGVIRPIDGKFKPNSSVSRADLAYSLVQSLGLQDVARAAYASYMNHYFDVYRQTVR